MGQLLSRRKKSRKRVDPLMELTSFPPRVILKIASKTDFQTFPKLYKTCKGVKEAIDLGQEKIRVALPHALEIYVRKSKLKGSKLEIIYSIRLNLFGERISKIIPAEDSIDEHFHFLGCFRLAKLSFVKIEDKEVSMGLLLDQLKRFRVMAEKISFGDYGFSQAMMDIIKPNEIEINEAMLKFDCEVSAESLEKLSCLTLRLEGLSEEGMTSAFRNYLTHCRRVDVVGEDESQKGVYGEVFCLIQKIYANTCFTRSINLTILQHKYSSVEPFVKLLYPLSLFAHHHNEDFFFCLGDKQNTAYVLVYVHWEPELRIKITACRILNRDQMREFVTVAIPLDRGTAPFLQTLSFKYGL